MNHPDTHAALAELSQAGLLVESISFDGTLQRCPTQDKPQSQDGAYIAYADAPATIWYRNWRTGQDGTWTAKTENTLTPEERRTLQTRQKTLKQEREAEAVHRHKEAAEKAQQIYNTATACQNHPYLIRKGIFSVAGLKIARDGKLIVPAFDKQGRVTTLQFIDDNGQKRFLTGGKKSGGFFHIGSKGGATPLLIAEGLATGLSLHEASRYPVLVAFDAGNLLTVAQLARELYQDRTIIICADNDAETEGNPGLSKATEAARSIGGLLAVPPAHEGQATDFNDLSRWRDLDAVKTAIDAATHSISNIGQTDTKSVSALCCLDVAEFLSKDFPARELLLSPVLPRQGLVMLHAARGIGKTFVSLSVAYAVASGGKVFDRWAAPAPARVLFIDGEMPARVLQERLASLVTGNSMEPPTPDFLKILTPDLQEGAMPNLATREGQEAVEPYLKNIDLVIMDNLATLARAGRSNDEESWLPVQSWLLDLRRRGISVLMVHHQGKNGEQRGTSAKEDILDTVIKLKRPHDYSTEHGARFEVHLTKARGICGTEANPFEAQLFSKSNGLSWVTRDIEDMELLQLRTLLADGLSIRDAAEEMGKSKGAVQRLKKRLDDQSSLFSGTTYDVTGGACTL